MQGSDVGLRCQSATQRLNFNENRGRMLFAFTVNYTASARMNTFFNFEMKGGGSSLGLVEFREQSKK